jgi:uncharacterized BrkB/YihY/UPF0761 family membrane protein
MNILDLIVYLGLGALMLYAFQYANRFHKVYKFDWRAWISVTISILLSTLALAWMYASLLEHEIQAAWVGLLLFAGLGIVFAFLARRFAQVGK